MLRPRDSDSTRYRFEAGATVANAALVNLRRLRESDVSAPHAPIVFQNREERLVEVAAFAEKRLAQHAFLNRAGLE
jgi:hypothetical protein